MTSLAAENDNASDVHVYDLTVADALAKRLVSRAAPSTLIIPIDMAQLRARLDETVASDDAILTGRPSLVATPGTYPAKIAAGGAVSIQIKGEWLGVKPGEFHFQCPYATGQTHLGIYEHGRRSFTITATMSDLGIREAWTSWRSTCDGGETGDDHGCTPHCDQTYVAYRATPRTGYRPIPDRQRITYLDDSSPLEQDPRLLGPWNPPSSMPRDFMRIVRAVSSVMVVKVAVLSAKEMRSYGAVCNLDSGYPHCAAMPCLSLRQNFATLMSDEWDIAPPPLSPWVWVVNTVRLPRRGVGA